MKLLFYLAGALIFILFCYFRLKPIYFQTVPYTYDQGRDFLQAQAIVRDHNLTLLGPTTGIQGLFHGVWWYYFLAIPYFIFQGSPQGFLVWIFLLALFQTILFSLFLKKEFGILPALIFVLVVTFSPYFTAMSFFAINTVLNLPALLLLFYSTYMFFKEKSLNFLFLIFFSVGFSFEAGVSFGVFLIPALVLTILLSKNIKLFFGSGEKNLIAGLGLFVAILPRIVFEIRHDFLQTKTVLNFILKPTFYNPQSLKGIFIERFNIFSDYFLSLFPDKNIILAALIIIMTVGGFLYGYKNLDKQAKSFLSFFILLFLLIFGLSLFYKDTFWANYAEGVSYFYVLFIVGATYLLVRDRSSLLKKIPYALIGILLLSGFFVFYNDLKTGAPKEISGMKEQVYTVETIYKQVGNNNFCTRVYTPPVIPYTYRYLFDYYSQSKDLKKPSEFYVKNRCWYIIEREPYAFRVKKWRAEHIPSGAQMLKKEIISDNISIELWREAK